MIKWHKKRTNRSAKVKVSFEFLRRSLVAKIPYSQRFVIRGADDEFTAGVEDDASHPIVMSVERE